MSPNGALGGVLLTWLMSGAAIGMALGITAQLTNPDARLGPWSLATALSAGAIVGMAALGGLAWTAERRHAAGRRAISDARGNLHRPPHVALYGIPMALAVPALLGLVVVVSVAVDSLVPAGLFGSGALALAWGARRLLSAHRLTSALEALEDGDPADARRRLAAVERSWLSTANARVTARLNLGLVALGDGELDAAARWYERVPEGPAAVFARAGLALVRVLQGRPEDAERALDQALSDPHAARAQDQLDAVRLLLVLRREGADAARSLGERLHQADSGELFDALLAHLRWDAGDRDGARSLVDPVELEASGWAELIPEVGALLSAFGPPPERARPTGA